MSDSTPTHWESLQTDTVSLDEVVGYIRARCPWSARLTHESLLTYLLEETYELHEALHAYHRSISYRRDVTGDVTGHVHPVPERATQSPESTAQNAENVEEQCRGTRQHVEEELGDVLYQVLLHCALIDEFMNIRERRWPRENALYAQPLPARTWERVQKQLREKLVRRHPHVFQSEAPWSLADVEQNYVRIKTEEKHGMNSDPEETQPIDTKSLTGAENQLPASMPALARAQAVLNRAHRVPNPHSEEPRAEEACASGECAGAVVGPYHSANILGTSDEIGRALWDIVCRAHEIGIDAEAALHTVAEQRVHKAMTHISEPYVHEESEVD